MVCDICVDIVRFPSIKIFKILRNFEGKRCFLLQGQIGLEASEIRIEAAQSSQLSYKYRKKQEEFFRWISWVDMHIDTWLLVIHV